MKRTQHVGKSKGKSKTKIKIYNLREARRIVTKNGWVLIRTNGGHFYYKHPNHSKALVLNVNLNRMVWERCVDEFDLDLNV